MENRASFLKGVLFLTLIPSLLVLVCFVFLYLLPSFGIVLISPLQVYVVVFYTLLVYSYALLFREVSYSDLDVLESVVIPQAPRNIVRMLKTTTRGTNRLVNVQIISSLGKKRNLIQSRLVEHVEKGGVKLTSPQIISYISKLERLGIIASKKAYRREYSLTEKGRWCYKAVRKCFPRRSFWFIVRHYLGYRNLSPFPDTE